REHGRRSPFAFALAENVLTTPPPPQQQQQQQQQQLTLPTSIFAPKRPPIVTFTSNTRGCGL
ncbi:hypothetical protein PMIN03_012260, partial [Paraphaeosphaeria minitans]